ncbi:unnamed protein product [Bursaphelenchus okinawaensis]|uniref:Uncharacterized protein n=1 Tax=Bursaphelenchus okinawaensis TaxID=465554 RepID=A0A811LBG8_9BILA|nr:unnamed protein product [Bursaphelenchus okinawaensis]CAG9120276.1 unnamed protein product [Bursaphelenchus okinawaensis]
MTDSESKARQKLEEAEKKSKKSGGFFGLFGGGGSVHETCDLYVQAGNLFKVAKNWTAAGNAFLKAAELYGSSQDGKHDSAREYDQAGNCFRKVDTAKAIDCLKKTAEIYTDMGRFNMAAKVHTTIAEIYETDSPDKQLCAKHYQIAADFYKGEESKSSATKCLVKVAQVSAELEQYRKAIEVYEEIALWEADHPTLKYAAKNHFLLALLCHLCVDLLDTQQALRRYEDASPSFSDSREYKFIKELTIAMEEQNPDVFTETVKNYDKISRLEPFQTTLLLKAKRNCGEGANTGVGAAAGDDDEEDLR